MNDRDSEAIQESLIKTGYTLTETEESADFILFNTCSVRDQAERKAFGKIGTMKKILRKKPNIKIAVVGCMAQTQAEKIEKSFPFVNAIVGSDQLHQIPNILEQAENTSKPIVNIELNSDILDKLSHHPEGKISAQIPVMRGCNEYCTYCIVPFTRGQEKSRAIGSILTEVKMLAEKGVKEIVFLGQNITAYGIIESRKKQTYNKKNSPFAELLRETAKIDGIRRIRFTSPHARYFNQDLIETLATEKKVCKGIHFPLQSGSNKVLKTMRRRYTREDFLFWTQRLKDSIPALSLSTDIIVGFPGETEEDFNLTRKLCEEISFDQQFIFRYSKRKNTPAAQMPQQVSEEIKVERNKILLDDLDKRLIIKNKSLIGQEQEVLVEGPSKKNSEKWMGRNSQYKIVIFSPKPKLKVGDFINVKINEATAYSLYAENFNIN